MAGCKKMVEFRDVSLISQRKHKKQQSIIQFLLGRIYTKKSIYEIVFLVRWSLSHVSHRV